MVVACVLCCPVLGNPLVVEATPDEARRAVADMEKANQLREMNLHPDRLQLPVPLTAEEAIARAAPPPR